MTRTDWKRIMEMVRNNGYVAFQQDQKEYTEIIASFDGDRYNYKVITTISGRERHFIDESPFLEKLDYLFVD